MTFNGFKSIKTGRRSVNLKTFHPVLCHYWSNFHISVYMISSIKWILQGIKITLRKVTTMFMYINCLKKKTSTFMLKILATFLHTWQKKYICLQLSWF